MENNNCNQDEYFAHFMLNLTRDHEILFLTAHIDVSRGAIPTSNDNRLFTRIAQIYYRDVFNIFERLVQSILDTARTCQPNGVGSYIVACIDYADGSKPHIHALVAVPKCAANKILALHGAEKGISGREKVHHIHVVSLKHESAKTGRSLRETAEIKFRYACRYIKQCLEHKAMPHDTIRFYPASSSNMDVKIRKRRVKMIKRAVKSLQTRLAAIRSADDSATANNTQDQKLISAGSNITIPLSRSDDF